ncbi:MAG: TolC family protein [Bacteroidales bacterium]
MKAIIQFTLLLAVALLFYGNSPAYGDQPWSLQDCVQYALDNNLRIQQQQLNVDVADEDLKQSKANLFPSLNANASHRYNYGRSLDPVTNEFSTERIQTNNFNLSSGVTIFQGFQLRNQIDRDRYDLQASRHDVEAMENDISLAVASAYLQVLFSKEMVEMAANQLEITRQQVTRTAQLVEAGTLARGSLLTIQAQEASEEVQLVDAENQLEMAYLDLKQLLDLREDVDFEIEIPDIEVSQEEITEYSPLQIYDTAVQIQPDVRSAEARLASADKNYDIARGGRSPQLSLSGSVGTGYSEGRMEIAEVIEMDPEQIGQTASGEAVFAPTFDYETAVIPFWDQVDENLNRSVGLFLQIPIFNNFQTRTAISRSRIALDNARLQKQIVRENFYKTIEQSYNDAAAAMQRYLASEKNVEALEESFRYMEQRFNVGMVNTIEYNDAKNRLANARSELLQAKYEYVFRVQILDFYVGNPLSLVNNQ